MKVNQRTQCYKCQRCGHLANQYPSQTKTLLVKVPIEDVEEGLEVVVHHQDVDSDASAEACEFNSCIRTLIVMNLAPSEDRAQLRVVRCTLAHPEQVND